MSTLNNILNPTMSRRGVIAGLAGTAAAAALAGCSSESGSSDSGSSSDSGASFKIGAIGPLTGSVAAYGLPAIQGAKLAAKDFSTDEWPLEVKSEDDQADSEKSINAFNTLCDWGMQALMGPVTTGAAVAVSSECNNDPKVFMLTPSASSPDVTDGKDCVFQVCFNDPTLGSSAATYLSENYADEPIAVFWNSGDTYSSGVKDAFSSKAKELGLNIVDEESFKDDSSTSFTNQLTSAQSAGATMIFAPIYYTPASTMLTNAHDMGYDVTFMACEGVDGLLDVEGFDTSLAEGVLLITPFSADEDKNADFVSAYQDEYGELPNQFAADGYDAVHAIAEALKKTDLSLDADSAEVAEKLSAAMLEIEVEGLTGTLKWNDDGSVDKDTPVYVIKDGKYVAA